MSGELRAPRTLHEGSRRFRGASPWSRGDQVRLLLWEYVWPLLCRWTPKPFNGWRLFWLRAFGAQIHSSAFVHQRARVTLPWNLVMREAACLGDGAHAYCLGPVEIGIRVTVAQEAYLCTGTHDLDDPAQPLITSPIRLETDAFIGARAFLLPGVTVGEHAVVGACAVVTRSVAAGQTVAGNPARPVARKFASPQ